jgi:hypothetical protein
MNKNTALGKPIVIVDLIKIKKSRIQFYPVSRRRDNTVSSIVMLRKNATKR